MRYRLTRHLDVGLDPQAGLSGPGRASQYLLRNALTGTRLVANDEIWEVLRAYENPRPLGDSLLEKRAEAAGLLCPSDQERKEDLLVEAFIPLAQKILTYRKVEPATTVVELTRQLGDVCHPTGDLKQTDHYLWQDPKRLFRVMLEHFSIYSELEAYAGQCGAMAVDFARASVGRPQRNSEFAQQLCTLHTSVNRVDRVARALPAGGRILLLGDDDLMSIAFTQALDCQVDVFEIDRTLIRFLKKNGGPHMRIFSRDLTQGLPEEFHGQYDAVLADPPYNNEGMDWFIRCCAQGLKADASAKLYLSTCPWLLEDEDYFLEAFTRHGITIFHREDNFNRYPFPTETHQITRNGLLRLGYHGGLIALLMRVPYLYAHLYEGELS